MLSKNSYTVNSPPISCNYHDTSHMDVFCPDTHPISRGQPNNSRMDNKMNIHTQKKSTYLQFHTLYGENCWTNFQRLGPLGRVGHRVAMSVCVFVCLSQKL